VAVGLWGGTFVVTKSALDGIGAFTLLWFRFAVAWLCLAPVAYRRGFRLRLVFAPAYVLFGLTGMVFHLGLETLGINYTSASSAAMIAGAIPALTAGRGCGFLHQSRELKCLLWGRRS
jgi:drug/metabolite transporter (DMT)-like permease